MPLSYAALTPDVCSTPATAPASAPTAGCSAHSYENRVYQVWLEDGRLGGAQVLPPRPLERAADRGRACFRKELAAHEIPVVAPSFNRRARRVQLSPCTRAAAGAARSSRTARPSNGLEGSSAGSTRWEPRALFQSRESLNAKTFGHEPRLLLLAHHCIPADLLKHGRR